MPSSTRPDASLPTRSRRSCAILKIAVLAVGMITPAAAYAREGAAATSALWPSWQFGGAIIVAIALFSFLCGVGIARSWHLNDERSVAFTPRARAVFFAIAMALLLVALVTPMQVIAGRLFVVQQTQILLLRMLVPMALVLSRPLQALAYSVPAPWLGNFKPAHTEDEEALRGFKWSFRIVVATLLFIGVFAFWLIPHFLDLSVRNPAVAVFMQATLLGSSLWFWACILDARFSVGRSVHGFRFAMLLFATLAQVGAGAYLTLKTVVLYPAFGASVRLFGIPALADETGGGATIWVAGSIICICTAIIVIHLWAKHEERLDLRRRTWTGSNSDALLFPTTGRALIELARPKNRMVGLGAAALAIATFALVIGASVLNHMSHERHPLPTFARIYDK